MDWLQNTPFSQERAGVFIVDYEAAEDFMPIRIKHHDNNNDHTHILDMITFITNRSLFLSASYTANIAVFGVLYGSV
jgi:hypothetical protein